MSELRCHTHTIRHGETITSIAKLYGVPREAVVGVNDQKGIMMLGGHLCLETFFEGDKLLVPRLSQEERAALATLGGSEQMLEHFLGRPLVLEGPAAEPITSKDRWVAACQAGTAGTGGQKYPCQSLQYGAVTPFLVSGATVALFILDNQNQSTFEGAYGVQGTILSGYSPNHTILAVPFAKAAAAAKAYGIPVSGQQESVQTNTPIQTGATCGPNAHLNATQNGCDCDQGYTKDAMGKCVQAAPAPITIACGHGQHRDASGKCVPDETGSSSPGPRPILSPRIQPRQPIFPAGKKPTFY